MSEGSQVEKVEKIPIIIIQIIIINGIHPTNISPTFESFITPCNT